MAKAKYTKGADGYYFFNMDMGYDDNGKRIRKKLRGKTIVELEQKIDDAKEIKYNMATCSAATAITLGEYADKWFDTYKQNTSINTKAMYQNAIAKHIQPALGHLPIDTIQKSDIQGLINSKGDRYETCNKIVLTLRQIFESALDEELVKKNPVKGISLPNKPVSTKRALTALEKKAIATADLKPMHRAFINVLFYFGLRREEALALTKNDFDFENGLLKVNKAIVFNKNEPILSIPKSKSSYRSIPIPSEIAGFFQEYLDTLSSNLLFTMRKNSYISQSSYTKMWKHILLDLNLAIMGSETKSLYERAPKGLKMNFLVITDLTAHIFRHNYATMLYYSGISIKQASGYMGHADTKMIMQVYAHLDEEKEAAIDKINNSIRLIV